MHTIELNKEQVFEHSNLFTNYSIHTLSNYFQHFLLVKNPSFCVRFLNYVIYFSKIKIFVTLSSMLIFLTPFAKCFSAKANKFVTSIMSQVKIIVLLTVWSSVVYESLSAEIRHGCLELSTVDELSRSVGQDRCQDQQTGPHFEILLKVAIENLHLFSRN